MLIKIAEETFSLYNQVILCSVLLLKIAVGNITYEITLIHHAILMVGHDTICTGVQSVLNSGTKPHYAYTLASFNLGSLVIQSIGQAITTNCDLAPWLRFESGCGCRVHRCAGDY